MTSFPASEALLTLIFAAFVLVTILGGLIATLTSRVIRSVCGLALCCVGLAGLYYFLGSPFIALMEILIYIGAVCITIVFAIMLAEPEEPVREEATPARLAWTAVALAVSGAILWALARLVLREPWSAPAARLTDGSVKAIGISLLTTYSMAFEVISLVLLVAILGALAIARGGRTKA